MWPLTAVASSHCNSSNTRMVSTKDHRVRSQFVSLMDHCCFFTSMLPVPSKGSQYSKVFPGLMGCMKSQMSLSSHLNVPGTPVMEGTDQIPGPPYVFFF